MKRRSNAPCVKFYKLRFLYSEGNFSEDKSVQVTLHKNVKRQGFFSDNYNIKDQTLEHEARKGLTFQEGPAGSYRAGKQK